MSDGTPQFTTAEYQTSAASTVCKGCGKPLGDSFYRANGAPVCPACAQAIERQVDANSHSRFVRGVLFGVGAAVLGLVLYVVCALVTGLIIGFVSLAVGYLVGKAIMFGSGGRGGRRYQIAAVLLTYAAVSLSAVPIAISAQIKARDAHQRTQADENSASENGASENGASETGATGAKAGAPGTSVAPSSTGKALLTLAIVGLASPFLALSNPVQGLIGLVILFVGIRIAWRMTAGRSIKIEGPLHASGSATAT